MLGLLLSFVWYCAIILFICFVLSRLTCGVAKNPTCLVGKTAIVTGGNEGIGYHICLDLAMRGCKVIIADKENSEETVKRIILETNNSDVHYLHLDLASFNSIRKFAKEFKEAETRLDILINNAGAGHSDDVTTEDGLNEVFQINQYGPFLLTHLLLDILKKTQHSRIIFTSAIMAFSSNLKLENMNPTVNWKQTSLIDICVAYGNSNVAAIMTSAEFAKRLQGTSVTSNAIYTGLARTRLYNKMFMCTNNPIIEVFLALFLYIVGKSPVEGAQTTIHVATSKALENVSGKYFWDCHEFFLPPQARDEALSKKVWETSEILCNLSECEKIKSVF